MEKFGSFFGFAEEKFDELFADSHMVKLGLFFHFSRGEDAGGEQFGYEMGG